MYRLLLFTVFALLPVALLYGPIAAETGIRSVQAEFTQEKQMKILSRPLLSRGTFVFQAPQSLRWEYHTPLRSIMLLHNGRMAKMVERNGRFEKESRDGISSMQIILEEISSWLDGRFTDNPMFIVDTSKERTVLLTPKEPGLQAVISRIELQRGEQAGVIDSVTIFEGADGWTKLTFSNTVLNEEIPAKVFQEP